MSSFLLEALHTTVADSIISLLAAVSAGVAMNIFFSKKIQQEKLEKESLEKIAQTAASTASEAEAKAIALIAELVPALAEKKDIEKLLTPRGEIRDVVSSELLPQFNLVEGLVNGYHQQALSQARVQFWFSVVAASVGFLFILYSAMTGVGSSFEVALKTVPGVVIDAVALLFFRQAEQTRERATALYDRLRTDSQMAKATHMVNSIDDMQIRSAVKAQIALHMAGLKPKEIDLPTFLSSHAKPNS